MHELGITRNIVGIVEEAAKGRRVRVIVLEIGKHSGVMPDAVAFCFDVVCQGTSLAGTELRIVEKAPRARCLRCQTEFEPVSLCAPCPCGSREVTRTGGEELNIKSIEVEEVVSCA